MRVPSWIVLLFAVACGSSSGKESEPAHGEEERAGHKSQEEEEGGEHEGHGSAPRRVELSAEARERLDLKIEEAQGGRLSGAVTAPAVVRHDISRVAHISPLVEGQIVRLRATLGDEVKAGQVVAVMHSVELGRARAAVAEARADKEVAELNFERQKKLRAEEIASERAFIEAKGALKSAKARLQAALARLRTLGASGGGGPNYPLKSRISGTIIEQHAAVGETKSPKDELFTVADQSSVWVIGRVYERDVSLVEPGMQARVKLDAYPERTWEGTVDWTASKVDEETRNLPVRVELSNPDGRLRPGLFGTLELIPAKELSDRALVPLDAVQSLKDGGKAVFVPAEGEGVYELVPVDVGAESDTRVEILRGIEPGQPVVAQGAFDLMSSLTAEGRSAAHHH